MDFIYIHPDGIFLRTIPSLGHDRLRIFIHPDGSKFIQVTQYMLNM